MSDVLYRKYRPQKFSDVVGQDHVVSVLKNSLKNNTISHAYLFAGSRGTGKTSVARIFARELGVSENDLFEIDAASNRGIDDIRELRVSVESVPFDSDYKVYIIDEVHMLTKEAFNALLKTLEEPPAYAIFILATTEIDRLPETIVSRTEVHRFKEPSISTLKKVVANIAKKEGYSLDPSSADLVALVGNGSFRDTLGALQKVLSAADSKKIEHESVERILDAPRSEMVMAVVESLGFKDREKGFQASTALSEAGTEATLFLRLVLEKLRYILLLRFGVAKERVRANLSDDEFERLETYAKDKTFILGSQTLIRLLEALEMVKSSSIKELPLELAIIDLTSDLQEKVEK